MTTFSTSQGTQDILPVEWPYWDFVMQQAKDVACLYGYKQIETPTFAETSLFARTSGLASEIVEHQMYTFKDRGGDDLSLRPEGTAPVMRAYWQHGMRALPQPVKLFYIERMYRGERPQRGRLREHHQFGCEAMGVAGPLVDVELIALLGDFYGRLSQADITLHINSIGDARCRPSYITKLSEYFRQNEDRLNPLDRERLVRNPLRILDSKERESQAVIAGAPSMLPHLCEECRIHWEQVLHGLESLAIAYEVDHLLVRGLEYYTRTVFEFIPSGEGDRQSAVGSGGRYDALSEAMGAPALPGVGFGTGIERLILRMQSTGVQVPASPGPFVAVVRTGIASEEMALQLTSRLRDAGIAAVTQFGDRSLKSQMRQANGSGARLAAILGDDEVKTASVTVRDLVTGTQETVSVEALIERAQSG